MSALYTILSQEVTVKLGWMLLHSVWQTAVIGAVLAVLLKLLHKAGANVRYVLACAALAAVVLWPVLTSGIGAASLHRRVVRAAPIPAQPTPAVMIARPASAPQPSTAAPATQPQRANRLSWKDSVTRMIRPVLPFAVWAWLMGVLGLSLWHIGGWGRLQLLRRTQTRPVGEALRGKVESLARAMRIRRAVRLVESGLVQVPSIIGWLRPMILLPASALTALPPEQLEALLAHELAHIRRHDYLVNILQTVVEILGFYHPGIWWISRQIRIERENCCDDVAARTVGDTLQYARALASMEDIRAGRPELALAASGGSLPARIRRLAGRSPAAGKPSLWAPALAAAALIIVLVVPIGLAIADYSTDPATELERQVLKGFNENRAKFTCGVLAWTHTTVQKVAIGDMPVPDGGLQYGGQYQMWRDGDKVATKYSIEQVHSSRGTPPPEIEVGWQKDGMSFWMGRNEGSNVFAGGLLAREPRWRPYENWFLDVIRWRGLASRDRQIVETGRMNNIAVEWSQVDPDGNKLIRRMARNMNDGGYSVEHYDPAKGYDLVREEWYTPEGVRRLNHTVTLKEVLPGAWFPVEVITESCSIQDGAVLVRHQATLDLARCRFNDRSALPQGIFEMLPRQEQDELRQIVEEAHRKQAAAQPADAAAKTQGPRAVVEAFIAAALTGDYEAAARLTHHDQPLEDTKELTKLLKDQELRVMAVFADDQAALAVTSAIRADGQAGTILFFPEKPPDAPTGWLIEDIDLETPQDAKEEIERFLQQHPSAGSTLESGKDTGRVVHFPVDRSIGALYTREMDFPTDSYEPLLNWQWLGEARGEVRVPAGKALRLDANEDAWQSGSPFASLGPDDVQMLDFSKCKNVKDSMLADVVRLHGLKALGLGGAAIPGEGLRYLRDIKGLKWLSLSLVPMGDEQAACLGDLASLDYLDIRYTKVTDAAMPHVGKIKSLKWLSLDGTAVTDAGLAHLSGLTSLHGLSVWNCPITDQGLEHLAGLTEVSVLDLVGTKISNAGLVHLARMKDLKQLRLGRANTTGEGLIHLRGLESLEYLELPFDPNLSDGHLAHLAGLDRLKKLYVISDSITQEGLKSLAGLKSLEELDTGGQGITDAAMAAIPMFPALKTLWIQRSPLEDAGLAHLARLKSLTKLELVQVNITGEGLASLQGLPLLTDLTLATLYIGEGEFSALGELTALERLNIGRDVAFSDQDMANLANLRSLKGLSIESKRIHDASLRYVSGLQSLESLTLSGPGITDAGLAHLRGLRSLKYLALTETAVTREAAERLQKTIPGLDFRY